MYKAAFVLLCLLIIAQTWSLTQIPYLVGVRLCHLLCQAYGNCKVETYNRKYLECITPTGTTPSKPEGNVKSIQNQSYLCDNGGCPPNFRCLMNRRRQRVCVSSLVRKRKKTQTASVDSYRVILTSERNKMQIQFYAVDVHQNKMRAILSVTAMSITALKAYGSDFFWCQKSRDFCGHARFVLHGGAVVQSRGSDLKWKDLTVDVKRRIVYGARSKFITKYTLNNWRPTGKIFYVSWIPFMIELDPDKEYLFIANKQNSQIEIYSVNGSRKETLGLFLKPCQHLYLDVTRNTLYSSQRTFVEYISLYLPLNETKKRRFGLKSNSKSIRVCAANGVVIIARDRSLIEAGGPRVKEKRHNVNLKRTVGIHSPIALVKITESDTHEEKLLKRNKKKDNHPETVIISTVTKGRSSDHTTLYAMTLVSGRLTKRHAFFGLLVSIDMQKGLMFRCQVNPQGIFKSVFYTKTKYTESRPPSDGMIGSYRCMALTMDLKKKVVFLLKEIDDFLYWFNIAQVPKGLKRLRSVKVPRVIGTDTTIFTDKAFHFMYAYRSGNNKVMAYAYSGRALPFKNLPAPARHVVYTSGHRLYFTTENPAGLLQLGMFSAKDKEVKILHQILPAPITGFALTKSFIITANGRNYDVYLQKGMKRKRGGRFPLKNFQLHSLDYM